MANSIAETNVKLTATAQQFVQEFQRADNASRRSMSNIDKEVDKLTRSISKKFSIADVGKGLVQGLGIGSGMQLAEKAAEMIAQHWKDAAESAERILNYSDSTTKTVLERLRLNETPEQELDRLKRELVSSEAALNAANAPKYRRVHARDSGPVEREFTSAETEKAELMRKSYEEARLAFEKLENTLNKAKAENSAKTAGRAADDWAARAMGQRKALEEQILSGNKAFLAEQEELDKLADKYRELADPALKFTKQIDEVNRVLAAHKITAEEAAIAIDKINSSMLPEGDVGIARDRLFAGSEEAIDSYNDRLRETERIVNQVGNAFENAFEDAIFSGEKFSDVLKNLGQDLAKLVIRNSVLEPLAKGIGSFFGGFFAEGGRPPVGVPSMVGEDGPELFVPDAAGAIIPNNKLGSSTGSSPRGGDTYYIDARGADQAGLMALAAQIRALSGSIEYRAVAAVNKFRRGGAQGAY